MTRPLALPVLALLLLHACASRAPLTLKVSPAQLVRPAEVHAVARYDGAAGPADRITWTVCNYTSSASVEPSDRTFEAFFPCASGGFPRVTLSAGGRVLATATTAAPLTIGATE